MKILMVTMGLDIGGAETHIVELSKELKQQGHEVVIVSNGGVYVSEVNAAGIRHYKAPLNRRGLSEMQRSRDILSEVIGMEKPDVVHAHARIPGFICGKLQKKLGFAFVTSCHGVYNTRGPLRFLSDWGQRTLAVSEDIKSYLIREYKIPEDHITVTINGIDTSKFSPEISGEKIRRELNLGDAPVLAHVCRLDAFTAPTARQLIKIAPDLAKAVPGLRIVIVGGGEVYEELREKAAAVNRAIGQPCLTLTGPRTDVRDIVAACDVFTGVSRAALEAMSAGKPAVLSGAQGHMGLFRPEYLEKAVDTNFCCRTDPVATDEQYLADLTEALTMPAGERKELGLAGRDVVKQYYSVRRMAQDCLDMYAQVCRKKYRVVMSGYYGFGNAGDDAILEATRNALRKAGDQVELTVLSKDPELTRSRYGVDAVPRFNMLKVREALKGADALLSGGGSLLQDVTSTQSLLYYLSVIRCAQKLGKPVMLYANGIGPVRRAGNNRKVKHVVELANLVTLRDHGSARELENMGVKPSKMVVTADPVFHLDPASPQRAGELLAATGLPQGKPFVVVSVRSWNNSEAFLEGVAALCDHLKQKHGLETLLVTMQREKDLEPSRKVMASMKERAYLLDQDCAPAELMAVLGQAKLCLAMRLHTLIFAARMSVPTLGLVYDPKVESYLNELALPAAGHVESFSAEEAIRRTDALLADYDRVLEHLKRKSQELTQAAGENERLLLELLEKTRK